MTMVNKTQPLDKKINLFVKGDSEGILLVDDVKSSLSNLKKRLKEVNQLGFSKEVYPKLFGNPLMLKDCLIIKENDFNRIFNEEIGQGLLEDENGK